MKKVITALLVQNIISVHIFAQTPQTLISGRVVDDKIKPVEAATISLMNATDCELGKYFFIYRLKIMAVEFRVKELKKEIKSFSDLAEIGNLACSCKYPGSYYSVFFYFNFQDFFYYFKGNFFL